MRYVIMLLVFLCACKLKLQDWDGVPDDRICSGITSDGHAMCISRNKVYQCVRTNDRMLCSRDTVDIKCTNIVNVETVCQGKP